MGGSTSGLEREQFWFFPMQGSGETSFQTGTIGSALEEKFLEYRERNVRQYFDQIFSGGTVRQIVLVDLLTALSRGEEPFQDMVQAISSFWGSLNQHNDLDISNVSFDTNQPLLDEASRFFSDAWNTVSSYGTNEINKLLYGPSRVLFAATKADHLPASQRNNLTVLLEETLGDTFIKSKFEYAQKASCQYLSSVRCTNDGTVVVNGNHLDAVVGRPVGQDKQIKAVLQIPHCLPTREYWERVEQLQSSGFSVPVFQPPVIHENGSIPHISLDNALNFLIGDDFK